ncbi:cold shock domain-containing protein [Aquimarina addita]|uniref:Cold shock domain-containing protein n=1 Tax=Aquimarina addita TaxID=870485 RepID=A0ABP6UNJ9_9FLAO
MAKSQQTFSKIEKEKKKIKKREDKQKKKEERRANSKKGSGFDNMIAYVDENGHLSETPPDPTKKKKVIKAENIEIGIPKREHIEEDPIKKGKIAFFNNDKGYGFINEEDTGEKYFVHINGLIDEVREGDKVTFELEMGMKGLNAVRVKKV